MIDPSLIDVFPIDEHDGYPDHLAAEDTTDALRDACGNASREFPKSLWIEPREWAERAAENDRHGLWAMNYLDRFTNQTPTHECTCHSLRANLEAARNRARGLIYAGPKVGERYAESGAAGSVWLSPLSVYAEANPDRWGGANVRQVLEPSAVGCCPTRCSRGTTPSGIRSRARAAAATTTRAAASGCRSRGSPMAGKRLPGCFARSR
jgi:hypothetical protein